MVFRFFALSLLILKYEYKCKQQTSAEGKLECICFCFCCFKISKNSLCILACRCETPSFILTKIDLFLFSQQNKKSSAEAIIIMFNNLKNVLKENVCNSYQSKSVCGCFVNIYYLLFFLITFFWLIVAKL